MARSLDSAHVLSRLVRILCCRCTVGALCMMLGSSFVHAQGVPVPQGGEAHLSTATAGNQGFPAVASSAAGASLVVWVSPDGDGDGIYGQRVAASGTAVGTEFRVNTTTTSGQFAPAVAMTPSGDAVVVWASSQNGRPTDVYGQRYAADGTAVGTEFLVNTFTLNDQTNPSVSVDAAGAFVVMWQGSEQDGDQRGIYGQRFAASGAAVGTEFQVHTTTAGDQTRPSVAVGPSGAFVAAWSSLGQDGSEDGVYARRFAASGAAVGPEFRVNTFTAGIQNNASVRLDRTGAFVIVWNSRFQDGSDYGVYAQRYAASGAAAGAEFRVNTATAGSQVSPALAVEARGGFVVTWQSAGQDGDGTGIYAQRYTAAGAAVGAEFRVNTTTAGSQTRSAVAVDGIGGASVVWQSAGQDGDGDGIYGQRYEQPNRPVVTAGGPQGEFGVNTTTADIQFFPAVASAPDGRTVVVWTSRNQEGGGGSFVDDGVYGQLYAADGQPVGPEFHVNTFTRDVQWNARVAMSASGDFVVVWEHFASGISGQDGSNAGVFGQRFTAGGSPVGPEFQVNTYTDGNQSKPAVAMDAGGGFVVAWTSAPADDTVGPGQSGDGISIYAQRYAADGARVGGEFPVGTAAGRERAYPDVAMSAAGAAVIVWQDASQGGVFGRLYAAGGAAVGSEFPVAEASAEATHGVPAVAMDADGGFVVTWNYYPAGVGDIDIYARRFAASGMPAGAAFQVGPTSAVIQEDPAISMDAAGGFVVTWQSGDYFGAGPDGSNVGVYARRFTAGGTADGGEFLVNTTTTGNQYQPDVAADGRGDFVAVWTDTGVAGAGNGQDGGRFGVFAKRFATPRASVELRGIAGYRMVASPVAGVTVGTLLAPIWTQGFPGADASGGTSNVYRYDEAAAGSADDGYVAPSSASEAMAAGRGYFAYVYADPDLTGPLPAGFPQTLSIVNGAPTAAPVALPVTYTAQSGPADDGWNLVGNPTAASIDWDLVARADVGAAIYVYDPNLPAYRVWASGVGDIQDGIVTAFQGFWVQAMDTDASGTVTPSVAVPAGAQVVDGGRFFGRGVAGPAEAAVPPHLAVHLTRGAGGYGQQASAFLTFAAGATTGRDASDAVALAPAALDYAALSTTSDDGTALAIQALPLAAGRYVVPLAASAVAAGAAAGGAFTLSWDARALPAGWSARLVDAETGASVDLASADSYAFEVAAPVARPASAAAALAPPTPAVLRRAGGERFSVVIEARAVAGDVGAEPAALALAVRPNPMSSGGTVRLSVPEAGRVRVSVLDVLGREVAVLADGECTAGTFDVALDAVRFPPGVYVVRLQAGPASVVRRITVAR